jgi:hypothetical protein
MKTYIIKNNRTGLIKIGRSKNPYKRLLQIDQIKGDCKILLIIDKDCEAILHNCFFKSHIAGEWFILTENDLKLIADYSIGINNLTYKFKILGKTFEVIKSNYFIELNAINKLLNEVNSNFKTSIPIALNTSENLCFIDELKKKYGEVISNTLGQKSTFVHLLLFLEIAKGYNVKIKIAIYEMLMGINEFESREIVKLAVEEAKEIK